MNRFKTISTIILSMFLLSAQAQNRTSGNEGGHGGGGSKRKAQAFPDMPKLEKAIQMVIQELQASPYHQSFKLDVQSELEFLWQQKEHKMLYVPSLVMPIDQNRKNISEKELMVVDAFTPAELGAAIYFSKGALDSEIDVLALTVLHETLHHVLPTELAKNEAFVDFLSESIHFEKNNPELVAAIYNLFSVNPQTRDIKSKSIQLALEFSQNISKQSTPAQLQNLLNKGMSINSGALFENTIRAERWDLVQVLLKNKDLQPHTPKQNIGFCDTKANLDKIKIHLLAQKNYDFFDIYYGQALGEDPGFCLAAQDRLEELEMLINHPNFDPNYNISAVRLSALLIHKSEKLTNQIVANVKTNIFRTSDQLEHYERESILSSYINQASKQSWDFVFEETKTKLLQAKSHKDKAFAAMGIVDSVERALSLRLTRAWDQSYEQASQNFSLHDAVFLERSLELLKLVDFYQNTVKPNEEIGISNGISIVVDSMISILQRMAKKHIQRHIENQSAIDDALISMIANYAKRSSPAIKNIIHTAFKHRTYSGHYEKFQKLLDEKPSI